MKIDRYNKYSTGELKEIAIRTFHKFIRLRDKDLGCICCGSNYMIQAGHFHPAGKHNNLRFNPDNVNVQCLACNKYKHGNLSIYRIKLVKKIGEERMAKLDGLALDRRPYKDDREELLNIISTFKQKFQELELKRKAA